MLRRVDECVVGMPGYGGHITLSPCGHVIPTMPMTDIRIDVKVECPKCKWEIEHGLLVPIDALTGEGGAG